MGRLRSIPVVFSLLSLSCHANYPTAPAPTALAVQVFYDRPLSYVAVGRTYSFKAYAVRSDGGYEDVTRTASWVSSDPQILRPVTPGGTFSAVSPGLVDVAAHSGSMNGALSVRVDRVSYPQLVVTGGDPQKVGTTTAIYVSLARSATSSESVTNLVTWTSADPGIVKVDGSSVTGVGIGTTTLSTSYSGLTVDYFLSVRPRS